MPDPFIFLPLIFHFFVIYFWGKNFLGGKPRILSLIKVGKSGHSDATLRLTASGLSDSLRGRTEQLIYTVDCEQALFCTKPLNLFETNEHFKMAETAGRKYRGRFLERVVFETRCFNH